MKPNSHILAVSAVLLMTACAHAPSDTAARADFDRINDPAEPTNRTIFGANQYVDRNVLKPVAVAYQDNVPGSVRRRIKTFGSNLGEPETFVNDMLQVNVSRAWNTAQRFVVNTTLGGVGVYDVATDWGLPAHTADLGQTLGVWGVEPGPAVQLPILGASNVRDTVGMVAGIVTNPLSAIPGGAMTGVTAVTGGTGALDMRATLVPTTDTLEKNSLDYYATLRSIGAQRRLASIEDAKAGNVAGEHDDEH